MNDLNLSEQAEQKTRKTSIVVLTYNQLSYNKSVLKSIEMHTKPGTYEVVVVDNFSTDGTREWLLEQEGVNVVLNDENVGFPKGCNIGIAAAEKENDILLLNNDVEVTVNWLENLQTALYSTPEVGAVGGLDAHHFGDATNDAGEPYVFSKDGVETAHAFAQENNVSDASRWHYTNFLTGYCVLIKRSVLDEVGALDERFSPGNFEDDDLSFRILKSGHHLLKCYDAFIHHYGGKSFRQDESKYQRLLQLNGEKFTDKWGFHAWDRRLNDHQLLRLMEVDRHASIRVLHLGCALGTTLFEVKSRHPHAQLFGVDSDLKYAGVLQNLFSVEAKIEAFQPGFFDFIFVGSGFLNDEADLSAFLQALRAYLRPDGCVLVDFPNLMHVQVLRHLTHGHWHYTEAPALRHGLASEDIYRLSDACGYVNPLVFHWYSPANEADAAFVEKLCALTSEDQKYLYQTKSYSVRLQNSRAKEKTLMLYLPQLRDDFFTRDVGVIPFVLRKHYDYDVTIVLDAGADFYPTNAAYTENLPIHVAASPEDRTKQLAQSDILMVFGLYDYNLPVIQAYKQSQPHGRVYCKLDMNEIWLTRIAHQSFDWSQTFLSACDLVTVESQRLQQLLKRYWRINARHIPNGYYPFKAESETTAPAAKKNHILTVGRPGDYVKHTDLVVHAFAQIHTQLPDWKLILVGPYEPDFKDLIDAYVERFPDLAGRMVLTGLLDRKQVRDRFKAAKVFCHTSRWEGFPNVLGEALGGGCYPVLTDFNGAAETLKYGQLGTVIPIEDQAALEDALLAVCLDAARLKSVSEQVQAHAHSKMSWVQLCGKIDAWLKAD